MVAAPVAMKARRVIFNAITVSIMFVFRGRASWRCCQSFKRTALR
jgi:hypothetical protein